MTGRFAVCPGWAWRGSSYKRFQEPPPPETDVHTCRPCHRRPRRCLHGRRPPAAYPHLHRRLQRDDYPPLGTRPHPGRTPPRPRRSARHRRFLARRHFLHRRGLRRQPPGRQRPQDPRPAQPREPALRRQPEARLPLRHRARLRLRRARPRRRPVRARVPARAARPAHRGRSRRRVRLAHDVQRRRAPGRDAALQARGQQGAHPLPELPARLEPHRISFRLPALLRQGAPESALRGQHQRLPLRHGNHHPVRPGGPADQGTAHPDLLRRRGLPGQRHEVRLGRVQDDAARARPPDGPALRPQVRRGNAGPAPTS